MLGRAAGFLLLWLVLAGHDPADLPAAAVAVVAATWASLALMPPGPGRMPAAGIARIAFRFPVQSLLAGIDVAGRALRREPDLHPGLVAYRARLEPGTAREAFCALSSMMPGTLPAGEDATGRLLIHCLDVRRPVAAQMAADEERFLCALGRPSGG